ncbi:MAG: RusA family crossover junction endodeoxyribonuclease [Sedimentisphaerales bacterium]|nr:RusA family crossover junction endodeoxyribonuclease [Sedimentisphaerales bacterium]
MRIEFLVHGRPAPGGSKSGFFNKRSGRIILAPASKYTKSWMQTVAAAARFAYKGSLLAGPISLRLTFCIARPKSHYGKSGKLVKAGLQKPYPIAKPDLTKLIRSTEDALTGIIWKDDAQVVHQITQKRYCSCGQQAGALITVETFDG